MEASGKVLNKRIFTRVGKTVRTFCQHVLIEKWNVIRLETYEISNANAAATGNSKVANRSSMRIMHQPLIQLWTFWFSTQTLSWVGVQERCMKKRQFKMEYCENYCLFPINIICIPTCEKISIWATEGTLWAGLTSTTSVLELTRPFNQHSTIHTTWKWLIRILEICCVLDSTLPTVIISAISNDIMFMWIKEDILEI